MFPRLSLIALLLSVVVQASADTFVVTNINDSGAGSLRQAITNANAHPNPANGDTIRFNIPGGGVHTITLASALPEITDAAVLDGWSQPGFQDAPLIELTAASGVSADGLRILALGTVIRGFIINNFKAAIYIDKNGGNTIQGCYLGTNATATQSVPNDVGIGGFASSDNQIGGPAAVMRNIISGNRSSGISLSDNPSNIQSKGNLIQGNYVGTDITGTQALPNGGPSSGAGIYLLSNYSTIGGSEPGAGNLVSGNLGTGVLATGYGIVVMGNKIGTVASGTSALGNTGTGLYLSSFGGTIGGTAPGAGNLISGNGTAVLGPGIDLESANGTIQGNSVGTDITGKIALPNRGPGISIGGPNNVVGGTAPGAGNLVSGNTGTGVAIHSGFSVSPFFTEIPPYGDIVQGNFIGTDITGMVALPNGGDGISVTRGGNATSPNRIGGTSLGARNLISGNLGNGIRASQTALLLIQHNLIGMGGDETTPLGNGQNGILMTDSTGTIGAASGPDLDPANTIAFNLADGIALTGNAGPVRISSNSIHDNGQLGIDLGDDGVTPNDAGDFDSGVNSLQNFSVINAAFGFNGNLTIYGSLQSTASKDFILEFFANQAADSSGFGEGQVLLGEARVTTSSSGDAAFNVRFPLPANVAVVSAVTIDSNRNTSEFSPDTTVSPTAPSPPPTSPTTVFLPMHSLHVVNVATRLRVEPGDHALIAGLIVSGTEQKKVIVRGIGSSLGNFGVPGPLADPILELYDSAGQLLASNDNWKTDQQSEIQNSGVAPTNEMESAIVATVAPGNYTAVLRGKGNGTGVGLVDAYDLAQGSRSHLANVSSRGFVSTGDNVMIGGFIVADKGGGTTLVIRAIGPSLVAAGIPDALTDPYLELHNPNGSLVDFNDNWMSAFGADEIRAANLAPTDDRESALYKSLAPGNYTAIVRGKNNATGVALVEVYDLGPQ